MTHSFPTRRASDLARQGELREAGTMEAITDVSPAAVDAAFAEHGVDTIIHGHTHRPAVHELEIDSRPRRRIVLGDWYKQGSVLQASPQGDRKSGGEGKSVAVRGGLGGGRIIKKK